MSIQGFSPAEIVKMTSDARVVTYTYSKLLTVPEPQYLTGLILKAAALTLMAYDTLTLFRREVSPWFTTRIHYASIAADYHPGRLYLQVLNLIKNGILELTIQVDLPSP